MYCTIQTMPKYGRLNFRNVLHLHEHCIMSQVHLRLVTSFSDQAQGNEPLPKRPVSFTGTCLNKDRYICKDTCP